MLWNAGLVIQDRVMQRSLECGDKDLNLRPAMPLTAFVVFWLYHYEPHFISYKISRAVPTSQGDWMLKVHAMWTSTL